MPALLTIGKNGLENPQGLQKTNAVTKETAFLRGIH